MLDNRPAMMPQRSNAATVELPPTHVIVYEKKLASHQPVEQEVEIVCEQKITPELVRNVKQALALRGYKLAVDTGLADRAFMETLQKFQVDNGLPLCGFNVMTLQYLNVDVR